MNVKYTVLSLGIVATLWLGLAAPAAACWSIVGTGQSLTLIHSDTQWDRDSAKFWAAWLIRFDALVPGTDAIEVWDDRVVILVPNSGHNTIYMTRSLAEAFQVLAEHYRIAPNVAQQARWLQAQPMTVQLGAFRDKDAALAFAKSEFVQHHTLGLSGTYMQGGGGELVYIMYDKALWRVVVGSFLDAKAAKAAQRQLDHVGVEGFVRRL